MNVKNCVTHYFPLKNSLSGGGQPTPRGCTIRPDESKITIILNRSLNFMTNCYN